jgi:signal transduction protein with GAF and PtsI domain
MAGTTDTSAANNWCYYYQWNILFNRLKCFNDRMADTDETLKMLFSVSQTLSSHLEINEIFTIVMDIIQKKFQDTSCAISLLGEDGFLRVCSQRGFSPEFVHALHLRPGEGVAGAAFVQGEIKVIADVCQLDTSYAKMAVEKEGIHSAVHIPLMIETKAIGVISVASMEKGYFIEERVETIATLAK